jgi:minor extracellular serine protease Vpr
MLFCKLTGWKYYWLESIIHNDLFLGVSDGKEENDVTVYPNPAGNFIRIQNRGVSAIANVEMIDLLGRKVSSWNIKDSDSVLDIKDLPEGICFLRILAGHSQVTRKIIINR